MLPSEYRLKKDKEIRIVLKKGKSFYSKVLGVKYLPNDLKQSRFCFIVANKISKKATKRNLLKRRLREIVRLRIREIKGHNDLVVMARAGVGVLDKEYSELEKDLLWILKKINIL